MNLLYTLVEFVTSFIEIYIIFCLFDKFFEKKKNEKRHKLIQLIIVAIITVLTIWLNTFSLYSYLTVTIGLLLIAGVSKFLYSNSFVSAITISVVYMVLINAMDFLTVSIVELLFNAKGMTIEVMTSTGTYRCMLALGMKALLIILYNFFIRYMKTRIVFNKRICAIVIVSSIFSFCCMQYLIEAVVIGNVSDMRRAVLVAWLFIILFVVSFILIIINNIKFSEQKVTNSIISTRLEVLEEDNKTLNDAYTDLAKMAHDFKKHMNAMALMAQNQKYDALSKYLNQIATEVANLQFVSYTGLESVDAVINNKIYAAKKKNIEILVKASILQGISIRDIDLCAIVVNLLDNAISACDTIYDMYKRKLTINIAVINSMVLIKVDNPYNVSSLEDNEKTDFSHNDRTHGYGLKIVKTLAQKYNGSFDIEKSNGIYKTIVMLSNDN